MPVYDYKCSVHGVFHELTKMADSAKPKACPKCQKLSPRIIMIPPQIFEMAPNQRKAAEKNEKARHSPIISTKDAREEEKQRIVFESRHSDKCGCGSNHTGSLKQQVLYLADGSKIFPSQRPWMISH